MPYSPPVIKFPYIVGSESLQLIPQRLSISWFDSICHFEASVRMIATFLLLLMTFPLIVEGRVSLLRVRPFTKMPIFKPLSLLFSILGLDSLQYMPISDSEMVFPTMLPSEQFQKLIAAEAI